MEFQNKLNPKLWGTSGWTFLHYIALGYRNRPTKEEKKIYYIFFLNLQNVLPCEKCSENFKENLKKYSLEEALENRDSLFRWTIDIHNEVNKETDKRTYSYEEVYQQYSQNNNQIEYEIIMVIALLLFIFFIIILIQNKTNFFSRLF